MSQNTKDELIDQIRESATPSVAVALLCENKKLIAQRDELLAALKLSRDMFVSNELVLPRTLEVIDEAIAKAVQP